MGEFAIRQAGLGDADAIYEMVSLNSDQLVPRSLGNIVESIDRFVIAECDGAAVGCASFQIHPEIGDAEAATVEIVSVAVRGEFRRRGIGRALVLAVLEKVRLFSPREVVVLTFAREFFESLDFVEMPKTDIMHKLYTGCINCTKHANPYTCPEIAMKRPLK